MNIALRKYHDLAGNDFLLLLRMASNLILRHILSESH